MTTGLAFRTINNSLFNSINLGWSLVLTFIATRYLVQGLGEEGYGIFALALTLVGYFAVFDLGLNNAAMKFVAEYHAKGELNTLNKIVWTTLNFFIAVGLFGMVLALIATEWLVLWFNISPPLVDDARFAFRVIAVGLPLSLTLTTLTTLPKAIQRYDIPTKLGIVITTVSTLITIGAIIAGYGLRTVITIQLATTIVSLLIYAVYVWRLIPELTWWPVFDWPLFKELASFGGYTLIVRINTMFLFQFDRFILAVMIGANAVTYYVLPLNLATQLHRIVVTLTEVLLPVSSALFGTGEIDTLRNLYIRAVKVTITVSTFVCAVLVALSFPILTIWIDADFAQISSLALKFMAIGWYMLAISIVATVYLVGFGKPELVAFSSCCTSVITITGMVLLLPVYGLYGAAITSMLYFNTFAVMYYVEKHLLHLNPWRLVPRIYLRVWAVGGLIWAMLQFVVQPYVTNLLILLLVVAGSGLLYGGLILLSGLFDADDRALLLRYLRLLTPRKAQEVK